VTQPPVLEFSDIQGWVLRAYKYAHSISLFARVHDAVATRDWLDLHADWLTSADWPDGKPDSTLNVAFTHAGLAALGAPQDVLDAFPAPFRDGMAARAEKLGDTGPSDPGYWVGRLGTGDAHMLVTVHVPEDGDVGAIGGAVRAGIAEHGMEIVHDLHAAQLSDAREHFGFTDGFSQPAVAGSFVSQQLPGQGTPLKRPGAWRPLAAGEFVLGYPDEEGEQPPAPPWPFDRNASYMVWRQLEQDVEEFYKYCDQRADLLPGGSEHVAAKMVGRWRDGSPLVLRPDAPDAVLGNDPARVNDFRYDADPDGLHCPLGAHVRRTNPRDALGWQGRLTRRHRIVRRGMPYGPWAEDPRNPSPAERGLAFVCFQADLERQFETLQGGWCADGDIFGLDTAKDPILANDDPDAVMVIPGSPPRFLHPQPNFVTTRGGEYLIVPSKRAVQAIADGSAWRR
jgi:Dyp-type peroxidase family